jgi:hypothetical protein
VRCEIATHDPLSLPLRLRRLPLVVLQQTAQPLERHVEPRRLRAAAKLTLNFVEANSVRNYCGRQPVFAPTTLSLLSSIIYAAFADADFWTIFGTFGTTEGNSNPNPHVVFDLVVEVTHVAPRVTHPVLV